MPAGRPRGRTDSQGSGPDQHESGGSTPDERAWVGDRPSFQTQGTYKKCGALLNLSNRYLNYKLEKWEDLEPQTQPLSRRVGISRCRNQFAHFDAVVLSASVIVIIIMILSFIVLLKLKSFVVTLLYYSFGWILILFQAFGLICVVMSPPIIFNLFKLCKYNLCVKSFFFVENEIE